MRRIVPVLALCMMTITLFGQAEDFDTLLSLGKTEMRKPFGEADYQAASEYLERAVAMRPDHAEARYFLGYAYSGLNSNDGSAMLRTTRYKTNRSSTQFEMVIQLEPRYSGEIVVLDPYAKITSEWGSLAIAYLDRDEPDSARWALAEGRRRGGFSNYCIAFSRTILDYCTDSAILVSYGDMSTFPLLYVQVAEGHRTDVSVVDISLLNTVWYDDLLERYCHLKFDLPAETRDTIQWLEWKDSLITTGNFSWIVRPSYDDWLLIRGDIMLMSMIRENRFRRDLYFITGIPEEQTISLKEHFLTGIYISRVNHDKADRISQEVFLEGIMRLLSISELINHNSQSDLLFIDLIRYEIVRRIYDSMMLYKRREAQEVLALMDRWLDEESFPIENERMKRYVELLRDELK
jgi:hypothetical protein